MTTTANTRTERDGQAGFTLIELLVVVMIIGLIASIALMHYLSALDKAKQRATMADMRSVARALEAYMVDNHFAPDDSGGVTSLSSILIPYQISVVPVRDHWGNHYDFASDNYDQYTLQSFGKDGADGADIAYATRTDFNLDIVVYNGLFVSAPE